MAMTGRGSLPERKGLLNVRASGLAGALSILLAVGSAGIIIYYLATAKDESAGLTAMAILKIVFLAIVAAAGVQLIRRRPSAQRFLLVVWLAGLIGIVATATAGMLWGRPDWWPKGVSMVALLVPLAGLEILAVLALVWASTDGSRLRYATNVGLAIAAAIAVVLTANMASQTSYLRKDIESLGRFSLSERTKRILDATDQPTRLTCVYTSTKDKAQTADRRSRVMELLREMQEHNKAIEVRNITTDRQKAELVEELKEKASKAAAEHSKVLESFQEKAGALIQALALEQSKWEAVAGRSYLDQWGMAAEGARLLQMRGQDLQLVADKVNAELAGTGLPKYRQLVDDVKGVLTATFQTSNAITDKMAEMAEIPPAVSANRDSALASADASAKALQATLESLGQAGQATDDPGAVLDRFVASSDEAIKAIGKTAVTMRQIAGEKNEAAVNASQKWIARTGQQEVMLPIGPMMMQRRDTVPDLYEYASSNLTRLKLEAKAAHQAANIEHQGKAVDGLRNAVKAIGESLADTRSAAEKAIVALATVDEATDKIISQASNGKAFENISGPVGGLLDAANALPTLEIDTLADDITGDDIVIVESESKWEVVDFETVWPLKVQPTGMVTDPSATTKRTFNGDSSISSKILTITNSSFATVLITYYRPKIDPKMERMVPRSNIPHDKLTALSDRLRESNFEVDKWNLAEDKPAAEEGRPQIMLVLPPPEMPSMSMPNQPKLTPFGEEHITKLRQAIDEGTPAIFLAGFQPPRRAAMFGPMTSPPYLLGEYLATEWGIEVLTDHFVVTGIADQDQPGKLRVDMSRLTYFPLSSFSDHVIGRHLQGQRMLWQELAIVKATNEKIDGVVIKPLLTVTKSSRNTWATNRLEQLVAQFQTQEGNFISPDYTSGDLATPFEVAVVATREKREGSEPGRIVVMGMGPGLRDGFLNQRVGVLNPDQSLTLSDPPRANADVIINSAYWLVGLHRYIAKGPAKVKPIAIVEPTTLMAIQLACVLGLPAIVLAIGGMVLFMRRR